MGLSLLGASWGQEQEGLSWGPPDIAGVGGRGYGGI